MTCGRLTDVLAHCWDKPWNSLSHDQREAWMHAFRFEGKPTETSTEDKGVYFCVPQQDAHEESECLSREVPPERGGMYQPWQPPRFVWDDLAVANRMRVAEWHDVQHDPAFRDENEAWFAHYAAIDKMEREIAEWEMMHHQGLPSQAKTRQDELDRLRASLSVLRLANPGEAFGEKSDIRSEDASTSEAGSSGALEYETEPLGNRVPNARPATQEEIEKAFPIEGGWGDKLKKAPSGKYKWLDGTWAHVGSRTPGDATTYYPIKVAAAIVTSSPPRMTLAACDLAIKKYFPNWWGEWEAQSELLRKN